MEGIFTGAALGVENDVYDWDFVSMGGVDWILASGSVPADEMQIDLPT